MRLFEKDGKMNFVDEDDVLIGFDYNGSCCEDFGYFFSTEEPSQETIHDLWERDCVDVPIGADDLFFDPTYCEELDDTGEGGYAVFKLVRRVREEPDALMRKKERKRQEEGMPDKAFLVLYNHHNGYYGHGFEVTHGGTSLNEGCL